MLGRQLGIVYLLLSKKCIKAAELAEHFEVSVRTIYRDVEALSLAGIPVYTQKGKNGGISLTENFVLNKMMLSKQEQETILAALNGMRATGAVEEEEMLRKLGGFFQLEEESWVSIDFSDWSDRRRELFELIKKAILQKKLLRFDYYGQNNVMKSRVVEPVQLLYKDYAWYLRGYCRERKAMRMFKIMRMKRTECLDENFVPNPAKYSGPEENSFGEAAAGCPGKRQKTGNTSLKAPVDFSEEIRIHIAASEAWRVYDRFEEEEVTCLEDGSFLICMRVIVDEWVYGMILSFGPAAEVIAPVSVKEEICRRLWETLENYNLRS
ncbi:MAG: YafY family protein [Eubacteriales bacterium]|nr:YafY family protein [Eubacteriales bacterium]